MREHKVEVGVIRHEVIQRIERMPDPRPVMITFQIHNSAGEVWRLEPRHVSGRSIIPVTLPMEWLTGDIKYVKEAPAQMSAYLDY